MAIHELLARYSKDVCIGALVGSDVQERIRAAIHAGEDSAIRRDCPLDPVLVVWLALALRLWRFLSFENVFLTLLRLGGIGSVGYRFGL